MPIDPTSTLARPQATDTRNAAQQDPDIGRDAFMKLLVTQLQHQDPLDPMDNREMVAQLSQLTGVEQLVGIQQRIGALEIATAGIGNTQASALVGRNVMANVDSIRLDQMGEGHTVFNIDNHASELSVTVRDAAGEVVRTLELGARFPGTHSIEWDGNDAAGNRMPPGRYSVEISAKDDAGHPLEVSSRITGRVSGIEYENGYPELMVGEARIMLGDVVSISE